MRILILAPLAPFPANSGATQRNLQILRWLGSRHEVTLAAFGDPANDDTRRALGASTVLTEIVAPPIRRATVRAVDLLLTSNPDLIRRLWSRAMIRAIRRVLREKTFDLVQIEGLEMFSIWLAARTPGQSHPPLILDEHNAEHALQASAAAISRENRNWLGALYSSIQAARLERYQRNAYHLVDGVVAVSRADEFALRELQPRVRSTVVPNGVDTTDFIPPANREPGQKVLFIGKMDYRPNVDAVEWLCREIWPLVRKEAPAATLDVVGRDPLPRVSRLGRIDGVTVVGAVPDERVWFQRAAMLVIPMRMGSGVRLKALQAMATATPIVSTTLGMSGICAVDGESYLKGDTPRALADQIVKILHDSALGSRLAEVSLELVRARYDWKTLLPGLDAFHREIVANA